MAHVKKNVFFLLLVVGFSVFGGIILWDSLTSKLRISTVDADWFNAPYTIAARSASLNEEVRIIRLDLSSGLASKTAVLNGDSDVGLAALPPLLRDPNSLGKLLILGCYMKSDAVIGVVHRSDGAQLAQPIAIIEGTISEIYLSRYAKTQGIAYAEFKRSSNILGIRPSDGASVLESESAGSAVLWEPHLSRAAKIKGVSVNNDPLYEINICVITSRSAYAEKRDLINRFVEEIKTVSSAIYADAQYINKALVGIVTKDIFDMNLVEQVDFSFTEDRSAIESMLSHEREILIEAGMLSDFPAIDGLTSAL